jgi:polar amino acid transport system substrate-binding protein
MWICKAIILSFAMTKFLPAFAELPSVIHIVSEEWDGYTNRDGTGAYWEIVKTIYSPLGIEVKTSVMPWKRAADEVINSRANALVGEYYDRERDNKDYLYPKWHLSIEDPVVVVFKKDTIQSWRTAGVNALDGKRVVWIRGYEFNKTLLKQVNIKIFEVAKISQGIDMLNAGRADALLGYTSSIKQAAQSRGIDQLEKLFELEIAAKGSRLYVAFTNNELSRELIQIFDSRMNTLVESGDIENIYMKWGKNSRKFGSAKHRFSSPLNAR